MKAPLLLLVLIAAGASASAGQVYSWTDANGTKHFSDSPPPPSVTAQKIKVRSQLTTDAGTQPATEPAAAQEPKPPEQAPPGATASAKPLVDSPENRAKQCQMAKSNLALLQSQFQVSAPPSEDGKTAVLDEGGRKQAIDKATDQVAFYCK
ncbi:MAG TPA: DUF4124 domain-containing protein [Rhodanobacteraceae bacterium]|nr:DUF4124 domain-containing protein [Rhodanobacteraceae bacterium]